MPFTLCIPLHLKCFGKARTVELSWQFQPPDRRNAALAPGLAFRLQADIKFGAMFNRGAKGSIALRLTLLSLMLAVQSLSFAHELSHYQAPDAEYCSICSGQPGNDALVQAETAAQATWRPPQPATARLSEPAGKGEWPDWQSRAPPTIP